MRFRTFRESIRNMGGLWTGNDVYFAQLLLAQWRLGLQRRVCRRIKDEEWLRISGLPLLSNGADDVETVHAIKTIEDCLWKQYPQY